MSAIWFVITFLYSALTSGWPIVKVLFSWVLKALSPKKKVDEPAKLIKFPVPPEIIIEDLGASAEVTHAHETILPLSQLPQDQAEVPPTSLDHYLGLVEPEIIEKKSLNLTATDAFSLRVVQPTKKILNLTSQKVMSLFSFGGPIKIDPSVPGVKNASTMRSNSRMGSKLLY